MRRGPSRKGDSKPAALILPAQHEDADPEYQAVKWPAWERVLDLFYSWAATPGRAAPSSLCCYRSCFRSVARSLSRVPRPGPVEWNAFFTSMASAGYTPATLNSWRAYLQRAYSHHQALYAGSNPIYLVEHFRDRPQPRQGLGDPRAALPRVLAVLTDARERGLIATARFAGLRRSELVALVPASVLDNARALRVEWQRPDPDRRELTPPKTNAGSRTVPVVAQLRPYLKAAVALAKREPGMMRFAGRHGPKEAAPFLFPFTANDLGKIAARQRAVFELDGGDALHIWRHAFIREHCEAGTRIDELWKLTGHSSLASLHDYLVRYGMRTVDMESISRVEAYQAKSPDGAAAQWTMAGGAWRLNGRGEDAATKKLELDNSPRLKGAQVFSPESGKALRGTAKLALVKGSRNTLE